MDPSAVPSIGAEPKLVESAKTENTLHSTTPSLPLLEDDISNINRSKTAQKTRQQQKRRRSQIVRHSLEGSLLPNLFPFPAAANRPLPNVPVTSPAAGKVCKSKIILARSRSQKEVPSRSLAAADNNFRAKTIFFYRDGDEFFTVSE
ncbi:hypothetical protein niasHT_001644 [Heterodera trifolii]|uniref:Uncharacterized protein n=1 Tax=Heterodera trifolii TaxID=157864 RepID=A0ABD2M3Q8_9BILA